MFTVLDANGVKQRDERLQSAKDAIARGKNHYDNLELELAVDEFERAASVLEKVSMVDHFRDWSRADWIAEAMKSAGIGAMP